MTVDVDVAVTVVVGVDVAVGVDAAVVYLDEGIILTLTSTPIFCPDVHS
jgi:hypothetical protein